MFSLRLNASRASIFRHLSHRGCLIQSTSQVACRNPVELFRADPGMDPAVAAYLEVAKACNVNCGELQEMTKLKVGEIHLGFVTKQ